MTSENPTRRWQALRFAARFTAPYRKQVGIVLLALFFTASITLSIGQGIRLLIDQGLVAQSGEMLTRSVLIFLALVVALAAGTYTRYYWVSWLGERVITDIRRKVFDHLVNLHPAFFETNRAMEIQSRLTADTTLLQTVIGSSVSVALRNVVMMIGGMILLFVTNPKLTAIVILVVPLVVVPILFFGRRVRSLSRHSQDRVADVGSYVGETLAQIKTVQAYNHQSLDQQRFAQVAEDAFKVAISRTIQRGLLIAVVIVLVLGAVGIMMWVGGQDVIQGRITGGELAAFVFYAVIVGSAVGSVSEVIGELQRAAGAAERIMELLASQSAICSPAHGGVSLPPVGREHLCLDKVVFAYPGRETLPAINQLSLSVMPGETLAIVGPSGAGKSTLFDLLLRFADPQQGSILLHDCDIRELNLSVLRQQFALVSQQPGLFHGTIADNLRYGKPDASDDDMMAAARIAHAHEFIAALPQGYQTLLGDNGAGLSGGQKQRIAIARALLKDAPILLLDEATSALDAQSEHLIQEALEKLMQGRTTLVIAHRLATVQHADRIAVLENGNLRAIGSHEQLQQEDALYRRLASLQFSNGEHKQNPDLEKVTAS